MPAAYAANTTQTEEGVKLHLSIVRAIATNKTRAMHIALLQVMESVLKMKSPSSRDHLDVPSQTYVEKVCKVWGGTVSRLAIEILQEIPRALGEVDTEGRHLRTQPGGASFRAFLSLWPLKTALEYPRVSMQIRKQLARRVKGIYDSYGIGIALDILSATNEYQSDTSDCEEDVSKSITSEDAALNDHVCHVLTCAMHFSIRHARSGSRNTQLYLTVTNIE